MPSVTVCIPSIGRASLENTLRSIAACRLPEHMQLDVVIADDGGDGAVMRLVESGSSWPFRICVVPTGARNVATARNGCLSVARGDYLAFIDDDETAEPGWLCNMVEHAETSRADAIFGPVDAIYPPATETWMVRAAPFVKRVGTHGSRVSTGSTCNALVRRQSIERLNLRFREEFGRSGGEDTDFFARLNASGALLVASETALVSEVVPVERLRMEHLRQRYIRGGQTYAKVVLDAASPGERCVFYADAAAKLTASLLLTAVTLPFRKDLAMKFGFKVYLNAGKLREALGLPAPHLY